MCGLKAHSPEQTSGSSPRDAGPDLTAALSFLPDSMWLFLTAWFVHESFLQF